MRDLLSHRKWIPAACAEGPGNWDGWRGSLSCPQDTAFLTIRRSAAFLLCSKALKPFFFEFPFCSLWFRFRWIVKSPEFFTNEEPAWKCRNSSAAECCVLSLLSNVFNFCFTHIPGLEAIVNQNGNYYFAHIKANSRYSQIFFFSRSFIIHIIFTTRSCKSTEVAFGEKTFINKFPAGCYSRFGSNITSCFQLPIPPCSKKTQSTVCPISCIHPAAFPICCGSAWVPLALHLTLVDHAEAQTLIRRSIDQLKTWIPSFISAHSNLQRFTTPLPSFPAARLHLNSKGHRDLLQAEQKLSSKGKINSSHLLSPAVGDLIIQGLLSALCLQWDALEQLHGKQPWNEWMDGSAANKDCRIRVVEMGRCQNFLCVLFGALLAGHRTDSPHVHFLVVPDVSIRFSLKSGRLQSKSHVLPADPWGTHPWHGFWWGPKSPRRCFGHQTTS